MWLRVDPDELNHKANRLDTLYYSSSLEQYKDAVRQKLPRRIDKVIGADMFHALYDWDPELRSADAQPNPAIAAYLNKLVGTSEFKRLRDATVGDRARAVAGAVHLYGELMRAQESTLKSIAQTSNELDMLETFGGDGTATQAMKANYQKMLEGAAEELNQASTEEALGDVTRVTDVVDGVSQMLEAADDLIEYDSSQGRGQGLGGADDAKILGTLMNEALINRVTRADHIRNIMRMAGRLRIVAQGVKSQKPKPAPTPVSVTYGDSIERVLGQELATLVDPVLKPLFYQKYLEKGLLVYDHKAKPKEGRGPFIVCVDVSGSMSGMPARMACAVFVTLSRLALKENRKTGLINFASYAGRLHVVKDTQTLLNALNSSDRIGHGTNFNAPLLKATAYILSQPTYKNADVILVTDGRGYLDSDVRIELLKAKQQGVRYFGLSIDGYWPENVKAVLDHTQEASKYTGGTETGWFQELAEQVI